VPFGEVADIAQIVPAKPGQVADLLGVAGARAEPERQVAAQVGPDGGHREPGRRQQPAVAGPAAGPGRQRAEEQRGCAGLAQGVHQPDPLLVPVQRGPVGQPGGRRGRGARDPGRDEQPGRAFRAGERFEQDRRGPAAQRQPHQRGMGRLAERDTVQGIGPGARGQRAHHGVGKLLHHGIKDVSPLDALGQGGWPGQQRNLAGLTGPPGDTKEGLPHVLCLPATGARVAQNRRCEQEVFLNHSWRPGQRLGPRTRPSFLALFSRTNAALSPYPSSRRPRIVPA
jgi:hypothetical protein